MKLLSLKFRYVSDMLAWIHQSMATERELLQALLKLCNPDGITFFLRFNLEK